MKCICLGDIEPNKFESMSEMMRESEKRRAGNQQKTN